MCLVEQLNCEGNLTAVFIRPLIVFLVGVLPSIVLFCMFAFSGFSECSKADSLEEAFPFGDGALTESGFLSGQSLWMQRLLVFVTVSMAVLICFGWRVLCLTVERYFQEPKVIKMKYEGKNKNSRKHARREDQNTYETDDKMNTDGGFSVHLLWDKSDDEDFFEELLQAEQNSQYSLCIKPLGQGFHETLDIYTLRMRRLLFMFMVCWTLLGWIWIGQGAAARPGSSCTTQVNCALGLAIYNTCGLIFLGANSCLQLY